MLLRIDRHKNKDDSAFYLYIISFVEKIRFKRLNITVNSDPLCSELSVIFPQTISLMKIIFSLISMFNNQNISHDEMLLKFWKTESESLEDVVRTRALLMQLPKIDKFKLDWERRVMTFLIQYSE